MAEFKSVWQFIEFCESVRSRYRFMRTEKVDEFIATIMESCADRIRPIPIDSIVWRAQVGAAKEERTEGDDPVVIYDQDVPLPSSRMMPLRDLAHEGRVNPKGIPCLYVASDKETAMSEVRPWLGAKVSVATLRTKRAMRVVDCSVNHNMKLNPDLLVGNGSPEQILEGVWSQIDRAYSQPINDEMGSAGYVPTQILAEAFRRGEYDGVVYKSRLGPGFNLAFFDLDCATIERRMLFEATDVSYRFAEVQPS